MKKWTQCLVLCLLMPLAMTAKGQVVGDWHGNLRVTPQYSLPLVLHIVEADSGYSGSIDSPEQGAIGIPMDLVTFDADSLILKWECRSLGVKYQGSLEGDTISGMFFQNGFFMPLSLARGEFKPKEADEPLPYSVKEVTFSADDVVLSGTLTTPKEGDKNIALLLVAGSGPNDRNSHLGPHKPFYDIADYLTRLGYSVLRYDKRGVGKSSGTFGQSLLPDFQADAEAAIAYLREQEGFERVGVIGHSEGGLIAQMIAADTPQSVSFIVLLAAPGVSGLETIVYQNEVMMEDILEPNRLPDFTKVTEETFEKIAYGNGERAEDSLLIVRYFDQVLPMVLEERRADVEHLVRSERYLQSMLNGVASRYYKEFLKVQPSDYLPRITCPILALNGSKDKQVEPKRNLAQIKALAIASPSVTTIELDGLNHLFIHANSGLPAEYLYLAPGFSKDALREIAQWLQLLMKD